LMTTDEIKGAKKKGKVRRRLNLTAYALKSKSLKGGGKRGNDQGKEGRGTGTADFHRDIRDGGKGSLKAD